jgi:hypothetical protein
MSFLRFKLDKNDEETFSPLSQAPLLDPTSPQPTLTFSPSIESPLLSDRPEIGRSITTAIDAPHSEVWNQVHGKSTVVPPPSPPVSPPKSSSARSRNPPTRPTILPQTTTEAHSYSLGGFVPTGGHLNTAGGGMGNRSAAASTAKLPRSFSTELLPTADDVYGQGTIADVVYEPFTGAPIALLSIPLKKDTLSPTVITSASSDTPARMEDPTRQKMWDYLAHTRGLQAEIAALHLTMDGAGIGTSPTLTTGGGKSRGSVGPGVGRAEVEHRTSVADPEDMLGSAGGEEGLSESRLPQEGKTYTEAEADKEANLDTEFVQLSALFAGKREAMNQIMTKVSLRNCMSWETAGQSVNLIHRSSFASSLLWFEHITNWSLQNPAGHLCQEGTPRIPLHSASMVIWCWLQGSCHHLCSRSHHVARTPNPRLLSTLTTHPALRIYRDKPAHLQVYMPTSQNRELHQSLLPHQAVRCQQLLPSSRSNHSQQR